MTDRGGQRLRKSRASETGSATRAPATRTPAGPAEATSSLQRTIGNRAVTRLLNRPGRDAPGLVGAAGRRVPTGAAVDARLRALAALAATLGRDSERRPERAVQEVLSSPGEPLSPATRASMESRFDHDLGSVRVHADSRAARSAEAVGARAFTVGQDVVFGAGQYAPGTRLGRGLLVHELTHTLQQPARSGAEPTLRSGDRESPSEREATRNASEAWTAVPLRGNATAGLQLAREDDESKGPLWFPRDVESALRGELYVDPQRRRITHPDFGTLEVRFAGLRSDFDDEGLHPSEEMKRGQDLVIEAIREVMKELTTGTYVEFPSPDFPTEEAAKTYYETREASRARLQEVFRNRADVPLNVFIATDITVAEKMSLQPLALSTQQAFVSRADMDDRSKMQAAIRVPLLALVGGVRGVQMTAEGESKQTTVEALTLQERAESMLHEMLHAYLIQRNLSANQIWEQVGSGLVEGPEEVKKDCETLIHYYLLAQEEVFVYNELGAVYSGFAEKKEAYQTFLTMAEGFLLTKNAPPDQVRTDTIEVEAQAQGKEVPWSISYKYPSRVVVTADDADQLNSVIGFYPSQFGTKSE